VRLFVNYPTPIFVFHKPPQIRRLYITPTRFVPICLFSPLPAITHTVQCSTWKYFVKFLIYRLYVFTVNVTLCPEGAMFFFVSYIKEKTRNNMKKNKLIYNQKNGCWIKKNGRAFLWGRFFHFSYYKYCIYYINIYCVHLSLSVCVCSRLCFVMPPGWKFTFCLFPLSILRVAGIIILCNNIK